MAQGAYKCSPLDVIIPPLFNALILCFPSPSAAQEKTLSILQNALSKTVMERPYLAGEVVCDDSDQPSDNSRPGNLSLSVPEADVDIRIGVNDMTHPGHEWTHTYESLRNAGMPLSALDAKFLAPMSGYKTSNKVMAAQANFIPGGCLLSVYFQHSFVDAYGTSLVMAAWAENCRELQAASSTAVTALPTCPKSLEMPPALQVTSPRPAEYSQLKRREELWRLLGLDWRKPKSGPPEPFQISAGMRSTIFSITPQALTKLKAQATPLADSTGNGGGPGWISTKDALAALLWRSIIKARFPTPPAENTARRQESIVSVAIDGRRGLNIAPTYIGNVVFNSMTELPIKELLSPDLSLAFIATRIRKALEMNKDPATLRSAVALAANIADVRGLVYAFPDWVGEDLILTSWVDLPFYEHEWGPIFGATGRTEFFRMPKGQFEGICSVQPRHPNGIVDVVIGLKDEQMRRLHTDEEFAQYLKVVAQ
jgi:hypothetical protein